MKSQHLAMNSASSSSDTYFLPVLNTLTNMREQMMTHRVSKPTYSRADEQTLGFTNHQQRNKTLMQLVQLSWASCQTCPQKCVKRALSLTQSLRHLYF